MSDGQIFVFGKNDRGQLGRGGGDGLSMINSESFPSNILEKDTNENFLAKDMHCG